MNQKSGELARKIIDLDEKWLQPFNVEDPFNNNLRLEEFLSQKPDYRYAALVITHIDGKEAP